MFSLNKKKLSGVIAASLCLFLSSCSSIQLKQLSDEGTADAKADKKTLDPRVVYRFFDDDFVSGGYSYIYPDESKVFIPEESGHESEVSLQFDLKADDYSGGSVCLYNLLYDVRAYLSKGALQFWVKGNQGGEKAWIALVDDENRDGIKTVVRLPLSQYTKITTEWQLVSIPLVDFGNRGVYWDPKKRVEVPYKFDWDAVAEFRMEIKKGDNDKFRVWADDIFILRDVYEAKEIIEEELWEDIKEEIPAPPVSEAPKVKVKHTLFDDAFPAGGFVYTYGKKTASVIQPSIGSKNKVWAMYQSNEDYSGVTMNIGGSSTLNLEPLRNTKAGLGFWIKAAPGVSNIFIGLIDDESDGNKVQTKMILGDFGPIDTSWNYMMIPIKKFASKGLYWDAEKGAEISSEMDWKKIQEIRFSVNRYENKVPDGTPVKIYVDDVIIMEEIPGYVDAEEYWASFQSDAQDILLHDFETAKDQKWEVGNGPKSKVSYSIAAEKDSKYGKKSLSIDYHLADWCDVMYNYKTNSYPAEKRDWTKHWGLKLSFYTEKPYQAITVQISDSGDELFVSNVGGTRGWNELLVPFKDFNKFPYYQPPEAIQNGRFDLDNVVKIDFKPSGEGTKGSFKIDNVYLTNMREVKRAPVKEITSVSINAKAGNVITKTINPELFGINAALWDGDMLTQQTIDYVGDIPHKVLRYPGGLRADEDHWKEVLDAKDFMVDTDEFLDFCKKTNTEPMITVNFGRGTPEEAAAWVEHVNIKRKANVRYWEIGNELYGDWHPNHCTAEEYGKRAAEFIKAMKAVDPSIQITVVWVLEGEWNKVVFDYTKDIADGVNVHHYPQHAGEENDFALLAAPSSLNSILPSVKDQVKEYGVSGKNYKIWLTEWNSVDFNPGPQTISIVNGLFVSEYLATLAVHNIDQASYWDIHNNLTQEGGDYGYLTRTGDPYGNNVPRPSYWAFKMTADVIQGKLMECKTSDDNVPCFISENDKQKAMLIINKYPKTKTDVKLDKSFMSGKVDIKHLDANSGIKGFSKESKSFPDKMTLAPYSITTIQLKK